LEKLQLVDREIAESRQKASGLAVFILKLNIFEIEGIEQILGISTYAPVLLFDPGFYCSYSLPAGHREKDQNQ
jgi:hypothetical protein